MLTFCLPNGIKYNTDDPRGVPFRLGFIKAFSLRLKKVSRMCFFRGRRSRPSFQQLFSGAAARRSCGTWRASRRCRCKGTETPPPVTRNSVEWRRRISGYPQVGRGSGSGRSMALQLDAHTMRPNEAPRHRTTHNIPVERRRRRRRRHRG